MTEKNSRLRNIVLVAHSGAGKTSLSEVMLFKAGMTTRIGRIEDGNTAMDFEPEEIKRQSSLSSSFYQFFWKQTLINLVDTPGDQNFMSDTKLCMEASDNVIIMVDSVDGVKVQTENTWEFANKFNQPCIAFINKLDKERSDFSRTVEDIENNLSIKALILQVPIMEEGNLKGIVDIISGKAYVFDESGSSTCFNIPSNMVDEISNYRETLIEKVAESDDELIEEYLEGKEISNSDMTRALKQGILSHSFLPILCGSVISNIGIGVELLMDFIVDILPSPTQLGPKQGIDPINNNHIERNPNMEDPFSAFVFKTVTDPYAGRLSIFRIVSGQLESDGQLYNSTKEVKERFNQLLVITGKEQKIVNSAVPGSIVAVAKLKRTGTGDTLCDDSAKIVYTCAKPLPTLISFAIEAKDKGDDDKVYISLSKLLDDDPALKLDRNAETKEVLISGLGQTHIEATIEKLKRKFNVDAILKIPKVPYRETIKKKVRVQGKHKKQSGGHGQFGDCWITMEPLPKGSGFEFVDAIVGGAIPKQYIPAVEKGIVEASQKGVLTGFPCVDFRATCDYGSYHAVDSSEMAFKIAGMLAYKKACEEANPVILEPIMKISVTVPDEFIGDIMGDLNSRRGRVLGVDSAGKNQVINAEVPLAEVQTYAPDLRSITAGRGTYSMEFNRYDEVPINLSEKVIEKIKLYDNDKKNRQTR